jgi:hypothetical protein
MKVGDRKYYNKKSLKYECFSNELFYANPL